MTQVSTPLTRYALPGLWALPVWGALLFYGTYKHQPPPQTDLAGWARFVTTSEFLASHLAASIVGGAIGMLGMVALLVTLASRESVRLGLWATVCGLIGNTLVTSVFGIAAFAQPAIGRLYLAGQTDQARALYYDAAQPPALVTTAIAGVLLLTASMVLFGTAVTRSRWLPKLAGVGLIVSGPVFFLAGAALDNFVQSIGSAVIVAGGAWLAFAANRRTSSAR